ncbi:3-hydroxyacyl-CoA dehydrogenase family protein [Deminuibacter soli]|uniref:3-hydroxyacyl-CoA dehydrogenase C-terminal domain-containing protein n=1 Tax=Deminuibacter soli TaxID=2291815 RepID=A0A3E1NPK5_9BACT|nr:3-hydroxyacyl-CoA dehydrogenase family protein [Deminuibacter soli]RFM29861.1 hypothetical protein DXN05_02480 [Deminuibacter soli]
MKIAVRASPAQQQEWPGREKQTPGVYFTDSAEDFLQHEAQAYVDLLHNPNHPLSFPENACVVLNSVIETCDRLAFEHIRINAWPGFLGRSVAEIAVKSNSSAAQAAQLMQSLSWEYELVADIPGMITARTVAALVNEAYFALGEGISTEAGIDIAMKLGTNYPYGPFEWAQMIGLTEIYRLLQQLSITNTLYTPAPALQEAVMAVKL